MRKIGDMYRDMFCHQKAISIRAKAMMVKRSREKKDNAKMANWTISLG